MVAPAQVTAAAAAQTVPPAEQGVPNRGGTVPAGTVPRMFVAGTPAQAAGRTTAMRVAICMALSAMT